MNKILNIPHNLFPKYQFSSSVVCEKKKGFVRGGYYQ